MSVLEEREVQRYYQPWLAAHGSSLNVAKHVDSIAQLDLQRQGYVPQNSKDKALLAFAQIVALQLNVRRCIISLIGGGSQYILAEASNVPNDLWLGSTILARHDAMCEHCLINMCSAVEDRGSITGRGMFVSDCRLDDRFKDKPYVQDGGVRFYAGVPIISRNGYLIGAVAVSDPTPRQALHAEQLRLLQETAQSVSEHLEWARDRVDRFKGERIVRGMATFIEESSSLREDSSSHARSPSNGKPAVPRDDGMGRMFARAANILLDSTLADGCAIFGATAHAGRGARLKQVPTALGSAHVLDRTTPSSGRPSPSPASDSEKHDTNTSDSDNAPGGKSCTILAYSLRDDQARADIEGGSPLTLGTLERYFSLFPQGRAFFFTEDGAGVSSEDESASDRESQGQHHSPHSGSSNAQSVPIRIRSKKRAMDHRELLRKIPGAKNVIFLPLYDQGEERLIAGCFLWTSVTGRMISMEGSGLPFLRAFGHCIVGDYVRMNVQRNEAAKTTFIASMSHELRSPLHGILGAAEFLMDTATDAYQSGLITSITTCGRTLLDTLNHVLDYSKINKLGRTNMRRHAKQNKSINLSSDSSLENLNLVAEVDLGILVEEVAEAVTAGHAFKRIPGAVSFDHLTHGKEAAISHPQDEGSISILLDISPRRSWKVRIQPGALRRIVMNLLGNALKYTTSGFVAVSLRAQEHGSSSSHTLRPRSNSTTSKIHTLIRVVDSGKGMSDQFQRERLFVPFSQEDPFQPGTGLGLSIVKQIVDSLRGSVDVRSQQSVGTEMDVRLSLTAAASPDLVDPEMLSIEQKTKGQRLVLVSSTRSPTSAIGRLEQTLYELFSQWFGMRVDTTTDIELEDADIFLFAEPPSLEALLQAPPQQYTKARAVIVVFANADDVASISQNQEKIFSATGRILELVQQPLGPRKSARVLQHCLNRLAHIHSGDNDTHEAPSDTAPSLAWQPYSTGGNQNPVLRSDDLGRKLSAAVSYPEPAPLDPLTPSLQSPKDENKQTVAAQESPPDSLHVLLVDDNKINRNLLVMFMKKCKFSYREAENGQEAFDEYKESCLPGPGRSGNHGPPSPGRRFDFVLMDISMPIMDGYQATKLIREFEMENSMKKTTVIALTGLASAQAQADAKAAGIDVFLPKPVKFGELKKMLIAAAT